MDVRLNETQEMFKQTARDFLAAEFPASLVRQIEAGAEGHSPEIWKKMAELGFLGVPFPEQCSKMYLAGRSTVTFYRKHKDWRIRLQMGWNPLALLWYRLVPKDGLLYQYFEKRLDRSHFARELILQHHYLSGIRSAL